MKRLFKSSAGVLAWAVLLATTGEAAITSITDLTVRPPMVGFWGMTAGKSVSGPANSPYPGLAFDGLDGNSLYAAAAFSYEGQSIMCTVQPASAGGTGRTTAFNAPVQGFAFRPGDVRLIGTTISISGSPNGLFRTDGSLGPGGGHGSYLYGFNGLVSDGFDMAWAGVAIDGRDALWPDDFKYSSAPVLLLILGAVWLAGSALISMAPLGRSMRR